LDTYKGIAKAEFGKRDTILLWHDPWNNQVLKHSFRHLHYFAKNDLIALSSMLQADDFADHFDLPLLERTYQQCCELAILLQSLLVPDSNDKW
jgi:hypothetical protein